MAKLSMIVKANRKPKFAVRQEPAPRGLSEVSVVPDLPS